MIYIIPNSLNTVALTLNEKRTSLTSDILFEFVNDITGEYKIFTASDLSDATERYNLFHIIDNATEDPYLGTMEFRPYGYWSYTIYEMNPSSPVDLDPSNAITTLEIGKVLVKGTDPIVNTFDDDNVKNNGVFDM